MNEMSFTEIRRLSLQTFIGFLSLTALVAIVSVLSGDFGETQLKILGTTLTISAASICSMSCAAFIEKRRAREAGLAGIFLSVAAGILVIVGIWPEIPSDEYWKMTASVSVLAAAFAHGFLLALPRLTPGQSWIQPVTWCSIGLLSILSIVAVWGEIRSEGYYRFLAVVAILVGLETLVIPLLWKLSAGRVETRERVFIQQVEGDLYRDSAGREFRLLPSVPEATERARPDRDPSASQGG